jgi:hypothetical protein
VSNGKNAEKGGHAGKEYWKSRLHTQGEIQGKFTKKLTHKKERMANKKIAIESLRNKECEGE